ncbi:lysophospholipid acyltransferase family protein [Croceivirga thetidis]|uniref:Lysophospholipid acyltransferase family protein n=1 Tax=Croceivirga thetidis TaxID=2721623 RepID=A0ABX1GR43_9FLAO|nr:lysophospholipid acyltransferase family protein [Croceivirga thetidis]NKI32405.1 lysophospholipid acyltransferase family protein [Croceivirga thetidis]
MQLLAYLIAYPLLWLVSRLPFRILYFISDVVYLLVYHMIGYRRKVVEENLKLVFPKKSKSEINTIQKKFYKHMCDMFLEMVKTMGISEKELHKRFTFTNVEVIHEFEAKNKSMMTFFPHYASWEWTIALDPLIQSKGYAIYQVVGNKYFDKLVRRIREKFGTTLISTRETPKVVRSNRKNNQLSIYGILSDQSPMVMHAKHWTEFMGIKVPVHVGAEVLCKKLNIPAVYLKVEKLKRGYYQGTFIVLAENPNEHNNFEITDAFLRQVEKSIQEAPEYYFWTHKRWKHRNKVPAAHSD